MKRAYKSGTEKREELAKRKLQKAGSDPNQRKLFEVTAPLPLQSKSSDKQSVEAIDQPSCSYSSASVQANIETVIFSACEENVPSNLSTYTEQTEPMLSDSDDSDSDNCDEDVTIRAAPPNLSALWKFVRPDMRANVAEKLDFLRHHPIQPSAYECDLPFNAGRTYIRTLPDKTKQDRKWLSYSAETEKVYCNICMAFSFGKESAFTEGIKVVIKHFYNQIVKHECSASHECAVRVLMLASKQKDIENLMANEVTEKRNLEVEFRRRVIRRIIDIILFIGKQGIAYRGHREEAAAYLDNNKVNHGNFLELILLMAKYDEALKHHVNESIKKSKERQQKHPNSRGRGALSTFLSKSFINKLIVALGNHITLAIADDLKRAKIYSIEVDSTQDISVIEQLAVCVRYVLDGKVKERLLKLLPAKKTTGSALYDQSNQNWKNWA